MPDGATMAFFLEVGEEQGRDAWEELPPVPVPKGFVHDTPFDYGRMDYDEYAWNRTNSWDAIEDYYVPLPEWSDLASVYLKMKPEMALHGSGFVMSEARRKVEDDLSPRLHRRDGGSWTSLVADELLRYDPCEVFYREAVVDAAAVELLAEPAPRRAAYTSPFPVGEGTKSFFDGAASAGD